MWSELPAAQTDGEGKHFYHLGFNGVLFIVLRRKMEVILKEFTLAIDKGVQKRNKWGSSGIGAGSVEEEMMGTL